jgi:hypothetical protein
MSIFPRCLLPLAAAVWCFQVGAAVPPPEKLLPKDTVLVITAPDWAKARLFWSNAPYARLWQDASLKPFKDKFMDQFTTGIIKPLEQNWGIKFSDYASLAQGQVTLAFMPVTPKNKSDSSWAGILVMDTKDHAGQLKTNLAQLIKKWGAAGKPMKSQKIRQTDFTTLMVSPGDLSSKKIFPGLKPSEPSDDDTADSHAKNIEITVGQSDSLLLVSTSTEAIDKILSRQAGGLLPPLEEEPAFQADYGARLRQSPFYVWLNTKALTELMSKPPAGAEDDAAADATRMNTLFSATGLMDLTSASISYQSFREGHVVQLFLAVPEEKRPALLKILAAEAKDSGPPSFVPADAVKFWRWRLNIAHSWNALEALVPPQYVAGLNAMFSLAGKDKDEHYDLKSELLNNLGDDIISYEKPPKSATLANVKSPPTLFLLASPNPDKLAAALKVLLPIPFQGAPIKDREFLGRTIYTAAPATTEGATGSGISFSASGGYVAISPDPAMLEEYLRSSNNKGKALLDMPGLAEAAQKVGGMGTGLFGFENANQTMRPVFDIINKQHLTLQDILGVPLPDAAGGSQAESLLQWADFSLLPPFDAVSKYFYFSVYAGSFTPDGFALKMYMPISPQLRQ